MNKWTERYIALAKEVSTWSKDPSRQIGAVCVSSNKQVLSTGYNGFPRNIQDSVKRLSNREEKYKYVVHAEMNCIYNACYNGISLKDSTLYIYGLPVCCECAKGIIQVGISKVIMQDPDYETDLGRWEDSFKLTKEMFRESGVVFIRHNSAGEVILD